MIVKEHICNHQLKMRAVCPKTLSAIFAAAVLLHTSVDAWLSTSRYPQCALQQQHRYASTSLITRPVASTLSSDEFNAPFTSQASSPQKEESFSETPLTQLLSPPSGNPTLYDILGASPNATRAELKQKYVALAKMTHPDAQRAAPTSDVSPRYEFSDIARAYRILSDPKERRRYDRSIQAELLTEQIASAVQNHPITELTIKAIGTIAIPLFRTLHQAAAPAGSATDTVVEGRNDGDRRATTPSDLQKGKVPRKSVVELERAAEQEYQALLQVRLQLQHIVLQRLRVALHTPQSGLTSREAWMLLESFRNTTPDDDMVAEDASGSVRSTSAASRASSSTGISWVERLNFLRSSVEAEIAALQNTEKAYMQQQEVSSKAQQVHQTAMQDLVAIRKSLIDAEREESDARRMLEQAMEETRRQRNHYERINGQLSAAEHAAALASNELERLQNAILKQSESVRHSLVRKERALCNDQIPNAPTQGAKATTSGEDKPDPPMSPQVYSFPSRRPRTLLAKSAFSPQLLHSSESSMLGPWPKQPFTLSQREHEAMLDSSYLERYSETTDPTTVLTEDSPGHPAKLMQASFDGPEADPSVQDHEKNCIDLAKLQQQEEDMVKVANALETRVSELLEQLNQLRQQ
jgi:curved DNA-binding protein CbpA